MGRSAILREARTDGPERSCVVTRVVKAPEDLIRFVAGPDGVIVPDLRRKLPGRGVWTSLSAKTVNRIMQTLSQALGEAGEQYGFTNPAERIKRWTRLMPHCSPSSRRSSLTLR